MSDSKQNEFDLDDPRLTAYALDELEGAERADVERIVAGNPEARAFVEDLRATAKELERGLTSEPELALSADQRAAIERRARPAPTLARRWVWLGAAAAGILAVSGLAFLAMKDRFSPRISEVASVLPGDSSSPPHGGTYRGPDESLRAGRVVPSSGLASADPAQEVVARSESVLIEADELAGHQPSPAPKEQALLLKRDVERKKSRASAGPASPGPAGALSLGSENLRDNGYIDSSEFAKNPRPDAGGNTEAYAPIVENAFKLAAQDPLSTFSIDVDTASYANVRRFLNSGQLPPPDAVRIEELLNYFRYEYPRPEGDAPFSVSARVASCPWAPKHQLVQIGLRGQDVDVQKREPSNLVFLIDVSGSMNSADKLPLLVKSMKLLVEQLDGRDKIAMVVYAGASGVVLPPTSCDHKAVILNALDGLQAGGSTNGAAGIELAYQLAQQNFALEGQNRVILCTDGDFNVGVSDDGSLARLIEEKRASGVFLSVLGFGTGNTKDSKMELLADKGNGNYAYIDTLNEARKVLVNEMGGTLFTIAKDVKLQLEFNPAEVQAWRLVGYENRVLAHQDFNNDKKDAGEIGAGHTVTALYEIVPVGVPFQASGVDPLKYQTPASTSSAARSGELLNLKLRYKAPNGDTSKLIETPVRASGASWQEAHHDFKFASAVAGFGLVLRKSANIGGFGLGDALNLAVQGVGEDVGGYRAEFVELVRKAQSLQAALDGKPRVR